MAEAPSTAATPADGVTRSNYLGGAWLGSSAWSSGAFTNTRQLTVLVIERVIISNTGGAEGDAAGFFVDDGFGSTQVCGGQRGAGSFDTFTFDLNIGLPFGGTMSLETDGGEWTCLVACYWQPQFDVL